MFIESLTKLTPADARDLGTLLIECVQAGASIGFMAPLAADEAEAYWRKVDSDLPGGSRVILVARETPGGRVVGSAQLALETRANGRHRAEVQKVMVRPAHRRRGLAAALMARIEAAARARGVRLLYLDTSEGAGGATAFYTTLGYTYVGGIPDYALDPDGTPAKNAIYYKTLASGA